MAPPLGEGGTQQRDQVYCVTLPQNFQVLPGAGGGLYNSSGAFEILVRLPTATVLPYPEV